MCFTHSLLLQLFLGVLAENLRGLALFPLIYWYLKTSLTPSTKSGV
jgi:hypothetical protein